MAKSEETKEVETTEETKKTEAKTVTNTNLVDEFIAKHLNGLTYDKNAKVRIKTGDVDENNKEISKEMEFAIGTNNILYDFDLTEDEFNEKVSFLHNTKSQDTTGIKFQYRVITKNADKFVVKFKSDTQLLNGGKVARTREKLEV